MCGRLRRIRSMGHGNAIPPVPARRLARAAVSSANGCPLETRPLIVRAELPQPAKPRVSLGRDAHTQLAVVSRLRTLDELLPLEARQVGVGARERVQSGRRRQVRDSHPPAMFERF